MPLPQAGAGEGPAARELVLQDPGLGSQARGRPLEAVGSVRAYELLSRQNPKAGSQAAP